MGNDIQVTSVASGKNTRVFKFTKKDSEGQTYTMTATIFDRNKSDNQNKNTDVQPNEMILDSNDAIQFAGKDIAQFSAPEIAPFKNVLFKDYDETTYAQGRETDAEVPVSYNAKGISDITLNTAKPMKLGQFKDAIDQLNYAQGGQQAPAGGQRPAGMPTLQEDMFKMSIPNLRALTNIMEESGYRGCMLMPDISANPYVMCADLDRALDGIFGPFMANLKNMMDRSSGGYVPNSTPSGQTSGPDSSPSPAEAKKAKEEAEKAKKEKEAEEAEEKAKKEAIDALKKKREEKVAKILKAIFDATNGTGTEEEDLKAAIKEINKDNVLEVLETWEKSPYAEKMDKSLIDTIKNDTDGFWGMGSDTDEYLKPIAEALRARSNSKDANLRADMINSDFDAEDVKKLYELVKKETNAEEKPLADPLDVKVEKQFEVRKATAEALKAEKEKAVEDAKKAEKDAKQELAKATKLNALWDEAIKAGAVPAAGDTEAILKDKIKEAKTKKPKTKAEKKEHEAKLAAARAEHMAEARANEALADKVKTANENIKKAEEEAKKPVVLPMPTFTSKPAAKPAKPAVTPDTAMAQALSAAPTATEKRQTEGVQAANQRANKEIHADKAENEDKTPWYHFWGKTSTKIVRDKNTPAVVQVPVKEAPKAEAEAPAEIPAATPAPAPEAPAPAAAPAAAPVVTEAKPAAKPALTVAEKKEIDRLSKEYISLTTQAIKYEGTDKAAEADKLKKKATEIADQLDRLGLKGEEIGALYEKAANAAK